MAGSLALLGPVIADAQTMTRVSVGPAGVQANQQSLYPTISSDGRWVAFYSFASNLVAGDTNGQYDVFVRDQQTGTTTLVSVSTGGTQGNGYSKNPATSADGRWVAFESAASTLVAGDTNGYPDVFLHDRQTGATTRVSVATGGAQGTNQSTNAAVNADGRYVAFDSYAGDLVAGDTNGTADVFVYDRDTGATTRVSVATGGAEANSASRYPAISADGRWVAFHSLASNLVAGDSNGVQDVFVHDRQTGTTTRASVATGGTQVTGLSQYAAISADGRWVAFESFANNLVTGDTNNFQDVFLHDRQTGTTTRVSVATGGGQGNLSSFEAAISGDGRWVAFHSYSSNLVTGDTNGDRDVFVHDRQTATTTRVSVATGGAQGNDTSLYPAISADGRWVAFESVATDLVTGDTNGVSDVFLHDRGGERVIDLSGDLAFGSVPVNTTATRTLTIGNSGTGELTVSSISYPDGFTGAWSGTVAAGGSQDVTVTFAPIAAATYGGTVTVDADHTSGTNTIAASGTGTVAVTRVIGLSGDLAFGNVPVSTTATRTLTISNSGTDTLTVSGISYPAGFSGGWSGGVVAAGGSQDVTVTFAPIAPTSYGGTVTVTADHTSGTNTIAASGMGTGSVTTRAELVGPVPGSTLTASTVAFAWTGGRGVTQYWFYVGSTPGAADLLNRDVGTSLTTTVTNLPTDGRPLYVRLWSRIGGAWVFNDVTLTAATVSTPRRAELERPAPGSTLAASTVAFEWTGGRGASQYWLYVGSTVGAADLVNRDVGTSLTATVVNLPTDGRPLYVRLWSRLGASWVFQDSTLLAVALGDPQRAELMRPAPSSTLSAARVPFEWTGGRGVGRYWLYVGSTLGAADLLNRDVGTSLTTTVATLPTDGRPLYVRLWSRIGTAWQFRDTTLRAAGARPERAELLTPPAGSTLTASTVAFEWTGGLGASRYWLYVGSTPGAADLVNRDAGTSLTTTVTSLPTDGRTLYVRLWSRISSAWVFNDETLTAAPTASPRRAELERPAPGSTLAASTVALRWTGGLGVSQYWLYVGSTPGAADRLNRDVGTSLTTTVANLPTGVSSPVYVRLWSRLGGVWQFQDSVFDAAPQVGPRRAELTAPAPSSTLAASTVAFHWDGGRGVGQYWLYVGSTLGGSDLVNRDVGTTLTTTVGALPTDGRTLYVRLWSRVGSAWQYQDATFRAAGPF